MKFKNTQVYNIDGALRAMRNPLESWDKSDSCWISVNQNEEYVIGENDMKLAQKLIRAGSEHRKFMRQIFVSVDITAPAYFFAELDTYKVGTTRNSTSFMHKGVSKSFTLDDFELDCPDCTIKFVIDELNKLRDLYLESKDYSYFRRIRQLLPQSYLYTSTVTMNYENLFNICNQRENHRLVEWSRDFIDWAKTLPYTKDLIFLDKE